MKKTLDAIDIAKYIVMYLHDKDVSISNLCLQRVLYVLQVEFLKRYGVPLFHNAINAWGFGPCVDDVYYKYCYNAGTKIWVLPTDTAPDIEGNYTADELDVIHDMSERYAPYLVAQDDATYGQLFGKQSLWARIHDAYIEEIQQQKKESQHFQPARNYNPPMLLDDIKKSILEIGCYPKVKPARPRTKDVVVTVAPLVQQMVGILTASNFDYELMGLSRYHRLFQWTEHIDDSYDVQIHVSTQDTDEPLQIEVMLTLADHPVVRLKPDELLGKYVLKNRNLTVNLTVR